MKQLDNNRYRLWAIFTAVCLVGVISCFMHELSHGMTAIVLGGKFQGLYVWPGVQLWPHLGQPFPDTWPGDVAQAQIESHPDWEKGGWQEGLVGLAGSTSNLVLAALALLALWWIRPRGWIRYLLAIESLMFVDILFYTFLPRLGLRHYFFIGGTRAEPLLSAVTLGIPAWGFRLFVVGVSVMLGWGLLKFVRQTAHA